MITVTDLHKRFVRPAPKEGAFKGIRSLISRDKIVKEAVQGISFTINSGEFVGYIGPNGAGKSTTIKMLSGILHPTSGDVRIFGLSPYKARRQVTRRLGVLFGQRTQLWWDLPTRDSYDILSAMYGLDPAEKQKRINQLTELLEMDEFMNTPVRQLSLGQRMRADIAAALLHDPDILFLDEPTIGLDVIAKRNIRQFLKTINQELGKTILLTTHDMDDIEQLCNRVIVINHGKLGFDGTIDDLRKRIGLPTVISVTYRSSCQIPDHSNSVPSSLRIRELNNQTLTVECNREELSAMEALRILGQFGEVEDVHMEEPDFEDVIHRVY